MNYTKKFEQISKTAARSKFARMAAAMDRQSSVSSFECGFSTWWWGYDDGRDERDNQVNEPGFAIFVNSNYHAESTLDEMYKTNCKKW